MCNMYLQERKERMEWRATYTSSVLPVRFQSQVGLNLPKMVSTRRTSQSFHVILVPAKTAVRISGTPKVLFIGLHVFGILYMGV